MASRIEKTPACIEMRAPQTTREKLSRPRSSVPNGCAHVGALRICFQSPWIGSTVAIHGASTAITTNSSTVTAPAADTGRLRVRRQARRNGPAGRSADTLAGAAAVTGELGVTDRAPDADARVEQRVRYVHQQVDQHVGAGGDEHHALDQRVVAREDRLDDEPTEAGNDEDLLGDDGAAD